MSVKKYLDYAGLQRYDDNWKLKFQEMIIDDEDLDAIWDELFPKFKFTVDTEAQTAGNKKTGIPFNLYGQDGIELTVNWGDGTSSTLTSSDYTDTDTGTDTGTVQNSSSIHEYAVAGEYTITVDSNDWENVYFYTSAGNEVTDSSAYFRETLISVNNAIPKVKGTIIGSLTLLLAMAWNTNIISLMNLENYDFESNRGINGLFCLFSHCINLRSISSNIFDNLEAVSFNSCFAGCSSLQSIPSELFSNNTSVIDFALCFAGCTSLQSIPSGLFDNNTAATEFQYCFEDCTSLQSISAGLFDSNTAATTFSHCFTDCTSLQSIPLGLFDNNTAVTTFEWCFRNCSSLQSIPEGLFDSNTAATTFAYCFTECSSIQSIPSELFINNINVTSFVWCFKDCTSLNSFTLHIGSPLVSNCNEFVTKISGIVHTIYVPNGSTTQTKFNAVASSLGLTVVGE